MGRAENIKTTLEQEIVSGSLLPGTKLSEPSLQQRFSTSRTPIREALNQLAAIGLIEMRPARSPVVAMLSAQELKNTIEVLTELEGLCGKLAAKRAMATEVEMLSALHQGFGEAMKNGDIEACYQSDVAFHDLLGTMSKNNYLAQQIKILRSRYAPYRRIHFDRQGRLERSFSEHAMILEAIQNGKGKVAAKALRKHVNMSGDVWNDFLRDIEMVKLRADENAA